MAKVTTSISIDSDVKREATEVFKKLGLNLSSGIDMYLRKVAREKRIPFELALDAREERSDDGNRQK